MSSGPIVRLAHTTLDADLRGILPQAMEQYLQKLGWERTEKSVNDAFNIWAKTFDYEVLVPLRPSHGDYCRRIHEALSRISAIEGKTPGCVYLDILLQDLPNDKE